MTDTADSDNDDDDDNDDGGVPPGWSYNPALWRERLPIVALALVGGGIALYLALFQWGWVHTVWDPFFSGGPGHASGSEKVLNSKTSQMLGVVFPKWVTDGFLGFLGYVGDAVTGLVGGTRRWRTMPWITIVFGVLVGPFGAVSIGLLVTQPLVYNTFCTLCCCSVVVSVLMVGPAMDEMLASLQYMKRVREEGRPFWTYFFGLGDQEPLPDRLLPAGTP